jgi:hypothetical protein
MYILNLFPMPQMLICACMLVEGVIFISILFIFVSFRDSVSIDCCFDQMTAFSDESSSQSRYPFSLEKRK